MTSSITGKGFPTTNSSVNSPHGLRIDLVAGLRDIVRYISRDSPSRAGAFALRLIARADMLQTQPESVRMVLEYRVPHIREIIFRPYRIVYRVDHPRRLVEVARVWHAARGTPEVPPA